MRRREFIALMGANVVWPIAALAQQVGRTYRLGIVSPLPCQRTSAQFSDAMRGRGFIEGQNLTIDCRNTGGRIDLISEYAPVEGKVDVIYAAGEVAIRAAQQATKIIPIIGVADDMVGSGLVNSMARPDGNTTGVSISRH